MAIVYIGIGSNLGNRKGNIESAFALLEENGIHILKISSIIETDPVDGPTQEKFLNAVIKAGTHLSAQELLTQLKFIEKKLGRVPTVRNGPRTIDLDILLYDQVTLNTSQLTIPHPRMFLRDFVMNPLKEIAPEMVGVELNKSKDASFFG
ncbi:MAG TPA: 2-amino-4-hydroxy-6-hydroxymethyldihydropteridine diphosphokinase [Candidatus Omnitrophica bacterium]|nr:MAG: 2-amino-4-hydroxy-6-hydroxymethyldihydropteridine diphosphokinase [Omnitrophica WOR_2 bacterium GWA2_45_18]HBR15455.1 2-amino-4-hydroxy-6-hydroxymethyldihydropteridine diphosphokinase [Candidatus Omnitrophota bacterium]